MPTSTPSSGGLSELHYIEGKSILIEYRFAQGKAERLPGLAKELVRLRVDAIFKAGTPSIFAVKEATKTIPVVFFSTSDPVGTGAVASLAHPGGNITGISVLASDLWPSGWSCSKKSFLSWPGWPWFGIKATAAWRLKRKQPRKSRRR